MPIPALERALEVEYLEPGPLSPAALHRVLMEELGHAFPRPTLVRLTEAAGGNPLYAVEIARELDRRGERDISARVPVPQSLEALVRARVQALPPRRETHCSVQRRSRDPTPRRSTRPTRARGGGRARARRGGRADRVRPPALRVGCLLRRSGGPAPRGTSRCRRPCARPGGASSPSRARGAGPGRRGRARNSRQPPATRACAAPRTQPPS